MLDSAHVTPQMQRTRGRALVELRASGKGAALTGLHQSGSAKAMLPRVHSAMPEVVFLNTAGGLTGGDHLRYGLHLAPGARATAATQTAERAYATSAGQARLDVDISLGQGAALDWLPQETILFEHSTLDRRTSVSLEGDARLLMAETIVLGRAAMGEVLSDVTVLDRRDVRRDGVPVLIEPLRLSADSLRGSAAKAGLNGARAFATVALVAPGAEDSVSVMRSALSGAEGVVAAVSGWDGKCVARLMAADGFPLRRALAALITTIRGAPMPRVWQI